MYLCQKLEHIQTEKKHGTDNWTLGYGWIFDSEKHYPLLHAFSNNTKLVNFNKKHSFSQTKDFISVF